MRPRKRPIPETIFKTKRLLFSKKKKPLKGKTTKHPHVHYGCVNYSKIVDMAQHTRASTMNTCEVADAADALPPTVPFRVTTDRWVEFPVVVVLSSLFTLALSLSGVSVAVVCALVSVL